MRIRVLSDLHLEFRDFSPPEVDCDVVVLAGDVHIKARGVEWASRAFPQQKVIYVCGNHEYYNGHLTHTFESMRAVSHEQVRVLEQEEVVIAGVRFLCATSWTDYCSTGMEMAARNKAIDSLNDFRKIRCENYRRTRTTDFQNIAMQTKAWLNDRLGERFDGPTVVVTHHAPLLASVVSNPVLDPKLHACYANEWTDLFDAQPALWIHGHSHAAVDYMFENTRVVCNPRGYPGQSTGFQDDLVVIV
ncbi:metallophosphoesterase [Pseudomonas aeruginosa]|uniref:metallophosphoesterase n=1 Tax=Pseudomonas aeruginosa TaxID=287 RepID=UPI000EB0F97E|nr:metallophosphoesterase [Pseudomonas aeruginosa]EIU1413933.1 metallophosphoesterase family protein [Pseudomonas aeruginosa]MCG9956514.1 metallophosphoesterase [Pseudomonas aeruginosa]MCS7968635.1 metallophosphoesterase [Pseudomonas aeruginosa]MCS8135132.1 metallophosphoesterase [Pseudomonas aeruginosa]MCS8177484.1 metallophosphoesterase [Pseudomonas aeruginosa]